MIAIVTARAVVLEVVATASTFQLTQHALLVSTVHPAMPIAPTFQLTRHAMLVSTVGKQMATASTFQLIRPLIFKQPKLLLLLPIRLR